MNDDVTDSHPELEPSPWQDSRNYIALKRLSGLHLSPDGQTLVVGISELNHTSTSYTTSLWRVPTADGERPRRLTRSVEGESVAAFTRAGDLLFTSARSLPQDSEAPDTVKALWCLPAGGGEAYTYARRDGGWTGIHCAKDADQLVAVAPRHRHTASEEADAELRANRKKLKVAALLHDAYPIRFWDHDLGPEVPLLLSGAADPDSDVLDPEKLTPINPDLDPRLASVTHLSDDGRYVFADWTENLPHGRKSYSVVRFDTHTGEKTLIAQGDEVYEYSGAKLSHDGRFAIASQYRCSTCDTAPQVRLCVIDMDTLERRVLAEDWDRWPALHAISADGSTAVVSCDDDGHHPLFAVDIASGTVRRITGDGCFNNAQLSPDGTVIYALRSSYTCPGEVVAVDVASGEVTVLPTGVTYPELPGTLERVDTVAADGTRVAGYLALPAEGERHPLALWIHGGPLGSWNDWSWRWCPWLMVAHGYAVLLPDPALSTGYGQEFIQRGWGDWGNKPYTDILALTDATEARDDIDEEHTCAMGGSFGGYMANWVATHTDRFKAIVTHASLWNLEAFGPTTDHAYYWMVEMTKEMTAKNSPHRYAENISTPMLVIHGDKDYRVPIGEGLALWWSLNEHFDGKPEDLPHRFLYYPDENHWILKPQHAVIWYETVLAFLDWHVFGKEFARPAAM